MELVPEPNIVSNCKKTFLDDPQWPKHIEDPQLWMIMVAHASFCLLGRLSKNSKFV